MSSGTARGLSVPVLCRVYGIPPPVAEHQFARAVGRKWALDFAWPDQQLGLEIDGGGYVRGRHHRPEGYARDCEKLNTALVLGWRVLRVTPEQVQDGSAFVFVKRALALRAT